MRKIIISSDSYHYSLKKVGDGLLFESATSTEQTEFRPFNYLEDGILMMSKYVVYKSRG